MRYFISGRLYWLALGVGMLVLVGGISVSAWLLQRNDGLGPVLAAPSSSPAGAKTRAGGGEVPGLPVRITTGLPTKDATVAGSSETEALQSEDAGGTGSGLTAADGASMSDSPELRLQRGGPASAALEATQREAAGETGSELTAVNRATVSDSAELYAGEIGPGLTGANVSDSAELKLQRGEPPPPRGGPGDDARFQDSAGLVVRDAKDNIKQQETVR